MTKFALRILATVLSYSIGAQANGPNVLLIAIDDLKPVLGCYGDETAITPSIDGLAKQGTVFLSAHCQWPVCGGSRASLMTGLRPEANEALSLQPVGEQVGQEGGVRAI